MLPTYKDRMKNGPAWDSGWYAEEANTSHSVTLTHGLNLMLSRDNFFLDLLFWGGAVSPYVQEPAWVVQKALVGMNTDDPVATSQGQTNPGQCLVATNTLIYDIYSALPLHSMYASGWNVYQTGFVKFRIWI